MTSGFCQCLRSFSGQSWIQPMTELGTAQPFFFFFNISRGPKCSLSENYKRCKHFGSFLVQINSTKHEAQNLDFWLGFQRGAHRLPERDVMMGRGKGENFHTQMPLGTISSYIGWGKTLWLNWKKRVMVGRGGSCGRTWWRIWKALTQGCGRAVAWRGTRPIKDSCWARRIKQRKMGRTRVPGRHSLSSGTRQAWALLTRCPWRLITLQYCSDFCHTLTWISHGFYSLLFKTQFCLLRETAVSR